MTLDDLRKPAELRLRMGEMTAQELRTAQAAVALGWHMAMRQAEDGRRYRAFFDAGLPITFLGVDYRSKADLDRAIDATTGKEES